MTEEEKELMQRFGITITQKSRSLVRSTMSLILRHLYLSV